MAVNTLAEVDILTDNESLVDAALSEILCDGDVLSVRQLLALGRRRQAQATGRLSRQGTRSPTLTRYSVLPTHCSARCSESIGRLGTRVPCTFSDVVYLIYSN